MCDEEDRDEDNREVDYAGIPSQGSNSGEGAKSTSSPEPGRAVHVIKPNGDLITPARSKIGGNLPRPQKNSISMGPNYYDKPPTDSLKRISSKSNSDRDRDEKHSHKKQDEKTASKRN